MPNVSITSSSSLMEEVAAKRAELVKIVERHPNRPTTLLFLDGRGAPDAVRGGAGEDDARYARVK